MKFNASNLPPAEIRSILYKCKEEGACSYGPNHPGSKSAPKDISTGDMLKVWKYACSENDFSMCDEPASGSSSSSSAPPPEMKVKKPTSSGDSVTSAYAAWCKKNESSCSLIIML